VSHVQMDPTLADMDSSQSKVSHVQMEPTGFTQSRVTLVEMEPVLEPNTNQQEDSALCDVLKALEEVSSFVLLPLKECSNWNLFQFVTFALDSLHYLLAYILPATMHQGSFSVVGPNA